MNQNTNDKIVELANLIKEFYALIAHSGEHRTLSIMYESELTLPQVFTIHFVSKCGKCSISSISEKIGLSLGATSHLVDRLVKRGFLIREENPEDRRIKIITITEKGNEFLLRLNESKTSDIISSIVMFDSESIDKLIEVLKNVIIRFKNKKGEKLCYKE